MTEKHKKTIPSLRRLTALVLLALLLPTPAARAEAETPPESRGYLVLFSEELTPPDMAGELEQVVPGVCRTEDLELALSLQRSGLAERVEPNYTVTLFDTGTEAEPKEDWSWRAMGGERAADLGLDGSGVRIGLIDSGIQADNPNLAGAQILPGYDFVRNTREMCDTVGHGTEVAQVLAGAGDGGVRGLAPGAELVPLRCFSEKTGGIDGIIRALWAAVDEYGCQVVNMSFGLPKSSESQALRNAVAHADEAGAVLVASAGNVGAYAQGTVLYPAAYPQVVGVGALTSGGELARVSMCTEAVYVCAPGETIWFRDLSGSRVSASGTSFSSPYIAGIAALLLQLAPRMRCEELRELLAARAEDLGEPGYDILYGYGAVSVDGLLSSPWLRALREGRQISLDGWDFAGSPGCLIAADYAEGGRMSGCATLRHGAGLVSLALDLPSAVHRGAGELRLYWLGEDLVPKGPVETVEVRETEYPAAPST